MKIAIITKMDWWDQYGLFIIANTLKAERLDFRVLYDDKDDIDGYFESERPDWAIYSVMTPAYEWFKSLNDRLKSKYKFRTIVGGPHFTYMPEDGTTDNNVDFVISGPGERVLAEVIKEEITLPFIEGPISDINILTPDRSTIYDACPVLANSKLKYFLSCRGCPHNCTYCYNELAREKYTPKIFLQRLSPETFVNYIEEVIQRYNADLIYIVDDDFVMNKKWLREFSSLYKKKINKPYQAQGRIDNIDEEIATLLKDSGNVLINLSLESANSATREWLNRKFGIGNDEIAENLRKLSNLGIGVRLSSLIGLPIDDPYRDAIETLKFNQQVREHITFASASVLQLYPKTKIWLDCNKRGLPLSNKCNIRYGESLLNIPKREYYQRLAFWWNYFTLCNASIELIEYVIENIEIPTNAGQKLEQEYHQIRMDCVSKFSKRLEARYPPESAYKDYRLVDIRRFVRNLHKELDLFSKFPIHNDSTSQD